MATKHNEVIDFTPMTRDDAMTCRDFHSNVYRDSDGGCSHYRVNGGVKTWKTRPGQFSIPVKRGLREHGYITEINLPHFHDARTCPVKH